MKPVIRFLARLYPRSWRKRYGDEFDALLNDSPADLGTAFDVLRRAIVLHGGTAFFWKCAAICSMVCAAAAFAGANRMPGHWVARAEVALQPGESIANALEIHAESNTPLVMSPLAPTGQVAPLRTLMLNRLNPALRIAPKSKSVFQLEMRAQDRDRAARLAHDFSCTIMVRPYSDFHTYRSLPMQFHPVWTGPDPRLYSAFGFLFGILAAISITGLRRAIA